jgi:hypothetical protein
LIARALDGGAQVGKGPECARGARVVRWEGARRADFWRPPAGGPILVDSRGVIIRERLSFASPPQLRFAPKQKSQ